MDTHLPPGIPGSDPVSAPPEYRQSPANEDAEKALLGALLINNDAIDRVVEFLRPEHFFFPAHARIYEACLTYRDKGRLADPLTLRTYFERDGDLTDIGGARYLIDLAASVISVVNAREYGQTIYELYLRRQLIRLGEETVTEAFDPAPEQSAIEQIQHAEEKLYRLAEEGEFGDGFSTFHAAVSSALETANRAMMRDTPLTGCTTGLNDLDRMLGGLQRSDLLILAGRPAMGKSALAANMAFNAAKRYLETEGKEGAKAAFFSLEMSSEQLATRILADRANVSSDEIRKGTLSRADFPRIAEAAAELAELPLFLDDTAGLTLTQLKTRALRLKRQHGLGMIVVDYLQLMRPGASQRTDNRVQEISEITRGLKMVAKDLDVPVVALSQLSRAVEQREDKRPQLADLRESGSIEQDADVVMFVFREAYYVGKREPSLDTPEHAAWQEEMVRVNNLAEVIVGKQRHGPTGTVRLKFEGMYTRFSNLETRFADEPL